MINGLNPRPYLKKKNCRMKRGKSEDQGKRCLVGQLVKVYNIVFVRNGLKVDLLASRRLFFQIKFCPYILQFALGSLKVLKTQNSCTKFSFVPIFLASLNSV
ncbi:hypothetical protein PRUPE_7G158800 [Prunus persica]|uniref:Uncharacterized protein n=1 Tax=Prunus persica TaxID=3760 RepID=A0A251NC43_PRUPE|nr:hypothetical protein PRUPE_7G158800 [Prunus persica]